MTITETVLAKIERYPGSTCEQIADCLEVEKKDISYAITRLLRRKLIRHYRPPSGPMQYFLKAYVAPSPEEKKILSSPKKTPHRSGTTGTFKPTPWPASTRPGADDTKSIPSRVGDKLVPYVPPVSMSGSANGAACYAPSRFQS